MVSGRHQRLALVIRPLYFGKASDSRRSLFMFSLSSACGKQPLMVLEASRCRLGSLCAFGKWKRSFAGGGCTLHMCICRWTYSTASCGVASSTFLTRSGQPWEVTSCLGKALGKCRSTGLGFFRISIFRIEAQVCRTSFEVTIYVSDLGAPIVRVTFGFIDSPSVLADGTFGRKELINVLPPSSNPFPDLWYCLGSCRLLFLVLLVLLLLCSAAEARQTGK